MSGSFVCIVLLFAAPAQAGRHATPSRPLPNATDAAFLHAPHLLRETNLGSPRFVAVQSPLPSIFTWWNILDATMASAPSGSTHSSTFWQTGYVRELQIRRMVELAQALPTERPVHYCEVGMNGGHSVVSMLLAHPNLTAHVFDPLEYDYSAPVVTLLTNSFQERFVLTKGYSVKTLPRFIASMRAAGRRCDLILIDGDHGLVGTRNDLKALSEAAGPHTAVVVDDVVPQCGEGPGGADEADVAEYCKTYLAYKAGSKKRGDLRLHRPGSAVRKVASNGVIEVAN